MLLSGVLSVWVQGTPLLSMKASQGQPVFHFFLGCPQWGLQIFPRIPLRGWVPVLSPKEERGTGTDQRCIPKLPAALTIEQNIFLLCAKLPK